MNRHTAKRLIRYRKLFLRHQTIFRYFTFFLFIVSILLLILITIDALADLAWENYQFFRFSRFLSYMSLAFFILIGGSFIASSLGKVPVVHLLAVIINGFVYFLSFWLFLGIWAWNQYPESSVHEPRIVSYTFFVSLLIFMRRQMSLPEMTLSIFRIFSQQASIHKDDLEKNVELV